MILAQIYFDQRFYYLSYLFIFTSEGSKSSTHYLGDKNRFDVSSEGPSSGISVGFIGGY